MEKQIKITLVSTRTYTPRPEYYEGVADTIEGMFDVDLENYKQEPVWMVQDRDAQVQVFGEIVDETSGITFAQAFLWCKQHQCEVQFRKSYIQWNEDGTYEFGSGQQQDYVIVQFGFESYVGKNIEIATEKAMKSYYGDKYDEAIEEFQAQ